MQLASIRLGFKKSFLNSSRKVSRNSGLVDTCLLLNLLTRIPLPCKSNNLVIRVTGQFVHAPNKCAIAVIRQRRLEAFCILAMEPPIFLEADFKSSNIGRAVI